MQFFGLHKSIYRLKRVALPEERLDAHILEIRNKIRKWQKLKKHGVADKEIHEVVGISRASYYRYKRAIDLYGLKGLERRSKRPRTFRKSKIALAVTSLILKLREENPTYGKAKIVVILKRDHGIEISESSVGRIIKKLIRTGKITRSISSVKTKRKRRFQAYAKRWQYNIKAKAPGELVQIDHMIVTKNNVTMRHFQAWDPITKVIVADVTSNATSSAAAKFLHKVIKELPFKLKSVQVDGGSEFMKDFEQTCQRLSIPLYVLPPKRPQYNGGVERGNRTLREEFYSRPILANSLGAFKHELSQALLKYNSYRPHFSLNGLTPFAYTNSILGASPQSHFL